MYIWQTPHSLRDEGHWNEPLQAHTEQWALSIANLMHQDSRAVIKVVRFGNTLACFPDEHTVEMVEKIIARQQEWKQRDNEEE